MPFDKVTLIAPVLSPHDSSEALIDNSEKFPGLSFIAIVLLTTPDSQRHH